MARTMEKLAKRAGKAVRKAYEGAETKFLVAQGRKAVGAKVRKVGRVSRKAARTGAIAGTIAAAAVIVREVRKARKGD
jgi:hypothetical protein